MAEAINSELHWMNIKSAAIITCRVSAGIRLSTLALIQVNIFTKTETMKMKVDGCVIETVVEYNEIK